MPLNVDILRKYPNAYFVETGTADGNGIKHALSAGFENIRSIELQQDIFEPYGSIFKDNHKVKLYYGNSETNLWDMISDIDAQITFWLDAHFTHFPNIPPLFAELNQIQKHPIKKHVILIDDLNYFGITLLLTESQLVQYLLKINENYQFLYEYGPKNSKILVAYPPVAQ